MSAEWYDMIARKNAGYKSNAIFTKEGLSGEDVFEERLVQMLPAFASVLDAGCGHGEFTLKMARYATNIIGFDNSTEMLKIAELLKVESQVANVQFVYANTKGEIPFSDGQFDLIYTRRGPTSIIDLSRLLQPGGCITGIHSTSLEKVEERLHQNGFVDIEIEVFDAATVYFPDEVEFAKFISAMPGNPDYTLPENGAELEQKIVDSKIGGRLGLKEWRYIWKARRPVS